MIIKLGWTSVFTLSLNTCNLLMPLRNLPSMQHSNRKTTGFKWHTTHPHTHEWVKLYSSSSSPSRHGRTLWIGIQTRCWALQRRSFSTTRTRRNTSSIETLKCSGTFWTFTALGSSTIQNTSASRPSTKSWPSTASCRRLLETAAWR